MLVISRNLQILRFFFVIDNHCKNLKLEILLAYLKALFFVSILVYRSIYLCQMKIVFALNYRSTE